ncbi:hypothetical protein TWF594_003268 [Orbilia oligospora]|uniref:Uncharacterized protein n=1 Tax=Orbilia oligospora TaxID=2813651 RepID=A0A7C8NW12_ORBOL|nr:hypothetical protein TWF103_001076 [Orbilia oligospora]KAF3142024.1 hypothetical protein TWF703_001247 [Orbilia oligospora]KAF3146475.1 hypothetical protein TWF594_003268 [Orbilia oligospora]
MRLRHAHGPAPTACVGNGGSLVPSKTPDYSNRAGRLTTFIHQQPVASAKAGALRGLEGLKTSGSLATNFGPERCSALTHSSSLAQLYFYRQPKNHHRYLDRSITHQFIGSQKLSED